MGTASTGSAAAAAQGRHRGKQRLLWTIGCAWTIAVMSAAAWFVQQHHELDHERAAVAARVRIESVKDALSLALKQLAALPTNLSHSALIVDFMAQSKMPDTRSLDESQREALQTALRSDPKAAAVGELLLSVARDFELPLTMLIDARGNVIANGLGDPRLPGSLVATNFGTRDYFRDSLAHGAASQYLMGRFSGSSGIYFASRIDRDGKPLGVVVIKQDAETLSRLLSDVEEGPAIVTDVNNVVVLGSNDEDLMRRVPGGRPLDAAEANAIYRRVPEPLGWTFDSNASPADGSRLVRIAGKQLLAVSSALAGSPFKAWVLQPLEPASAIVARNAAAGIAVWLAGCLALWLSWRRYRLLAAEQRARRELLDLAQALPLTVFRYLKPTDGPGRFSFIGRDPKPLLGIDEAQLHEDPSRAWKLAGAALDHPPTQLKEFAIRRADQTVWVCADSTPQVQADGATAYYGYWLDISLRREAETRFAAVFEHAPSGFLFFDRKRGVTHCNPSALALFGLNEPAELIGRIPWFPPLSPELQADGRSSRESVLELMRQHMRSGARVQSNEWRFQRVDGSSFDSEVSVIALEWAGEPSFCAIIEDITQRRRVEAESQRARAEAEAASQTKSSFLANMSHELRTPMNAIIGMTHLALEDGLPERQRDYVEKAHGAAGSLLQILNDILDVSKIEAGHLELEQIEFDLETVVSEMADVLGLKADEKGLELLFTAAPDLPSRLVGDPTRLRQVLVNLGGNAIKFTERGEVTVGMVVQSQDERSVEIHGWVRDTGLGMTADEKARVFQPFVQGDSSTTRRFGGTGLGLVICRQLIERMGGRLWVDSEPGKGSTFHFTVRFGRLASRASERAWTAGELRGHRALLVDDNAAALAVLCRMLEDLGVRVDRAEGGEAGLALFDQAPDAYTWVLLDWKMPRLDGVGCARLIAERYPEARPCLLLVTAFARDDALRASVAAGVQFAGVLQKPVTPSSLHDNLLRARERGHQRLPLAAGAMLPAVALSVTRRDAAAPAGSALPIDQARAALAGARILLVEDHPLNQELARELLKRAGIDVVVAGDGQQALHELTTNGPFDGVLMDCQMPVMDGYTATRRLRERPEWRQLPVIAMTASALAEDRERALASGMDAHITKPLNVELMLRTLSQWVVPRRRAGVQPAPVMDTLWPSLPVSAPVTPAIDVTDGLARCMGRVSLFHRMLRGFRQAKSEFPADLRAAIANDRWDEAIRRAHDLKGLAGTISAPRLRAAAQALHEAVIVHDLGAIERQLTGEVEPELAAVIADIDRLLLEAAPVEGAS